MKTQEFNKWLADYQVRFPDSAKWFERNPATVELWRDEIFSKLSLAACLAANKELMTSDEPIKAYERETIAARVSKIARRVAWQRQRPDESWRENALRPPATYEPGEKPINEAFRDVVRQRGLRN